MLPGFSIGGDEETRTPDPLHAKQVLYQLSYIPTFLLLLSRSTPRPSIPRVLRYLRMTTDLKMTPGCSNLGMTPG